ncbi:bifunctional phosphoribosylaminoimidazolecarboxamide formyltransferase/IMP cyclohydrolase [Rubrivirga sp. S365]|uniref:bifunctional phosphoribosylaminoimidazolecarboxamide formyltransferase/IMP cyclohydrolase n=1 Tax=Rubrivirga sp. S365 TaxID=3076080 RepID=UPI0028C7D6F6|nr:bifunctional phosphoribosylaminoimidazolecarboxamide formyltransferase/IMP cyclohydrolase [Rubrivirga sp. S365]MDT7857627.1 bifunctional phosphoribosylaminoimidazolecarboxamide formyltransferase/IMP cyclohydrolase [Rubrivirga sp. S365]
MIETADLPAPDDRAPVRRALLSVSDKSGLAELGRRLAALGVELLSTGGTARALRDAGLDVTDVADVTGFPEILGGRVKSLHPRVHGGILARRTSAADLAELDEHGIGAIDLVVVNLYPFREAVASADVTDALAAENVDIGGPGMLRAAAKNFAFVGAVVDPGDYDAVAQELEDHGGTLGLATRRRLAHAAFAHTADYDAAIAAYFAGGADSEGGAATGGAEDDAAAPLPDALFLDLPRAEALRYGENPHQAAALYGDPAARYEALHGKALSYNNLLDLTAALDLIAEFDAAPPTVAILKHTNPCGVGQAAGGLEAAYHKAFATDRQSPFGGIVVVNRPLDRATAEAIDAVFTEIVIAPAFEDGVLAFLEQKKNRRLVRALPRPARPAPVLRSVAGGVLAQAPDGPLAPAAELRDAWSVPTERAPTEREWADLDFAWRVCKHVKSNAIVYARDGATLGVGAGQMSRIDASEVAVAKGAKSGLDFAGCVVASDAFFPFADGLEAAAEAGAVAAVQPGGSVRDDEVVAAADARGLAMAFTGRRHFRH